MDDLDAFEKRLNSIQHNVDSKVGGRSSYGSNDGGRQGNSRFGLKQLRARGAPPVEEESPKQGPYRGRPRRSELNEYKPSAIVEQLELDNTRESASQVEYLSKNFLRTLKDEEPVKNWDYGYICPLPGPLRKAQLKAKEREAAVEFKLPELDDLVMNIWRPDNFAERNSYKDFQRDKLYTEQGMGSADPLGLTGETTCSPASSIMSEATTVNTTAASSRTSISNSTEGMSAQQIDKLNSERKKRQEEQEVSRRKANEEAKRKRQEAYEQEVKEKQRREHLKMKKTMMERKIIEESANLPENLKEFDLVGSILMAGLNEQRKLQKSLKPKSNGASEQVSSSTSSVSTPATTHHCEICDHTSSTLTDHTMHCNSNDHLAKAEAKKKSEVEDYYKKLKIKVPAPKPEPSSSTDTVKNEVKTTQITEAKPYENSHPSPPPMDLEDDFGGASPCPSNAPSVESDNEIEEIKPLATSLVTEEKPVITSDTSDQETKPPLEQQQTTESKPRLYTLPVPKLQSTESKPRKFELPAPVAPRPPPTDGLARILYILETNESLTLQQLSGMV